jgi:hypothetical protein
MPENVEDSYAVYGSQNGRVLRSDGTERVNYETGKFCHLYRSKLIDSRGNWTWIDQTAPLSGPNRLRLFLPAAWLADATFPVTLDPTFGYTSQGSLGIARSYLHAYGQFTPASNGSATAMSIYNGTGYTPDTTLGIYSDSAGSPSSLLKDTAGFTQAQSQWNSANLDSALAVTAGTNYWLAAQWGYANVYVDSASGKCKLNTGAYSYSSGSLPSSFGSVTNTQDYIGSIYATYTQAGWTHKIHGIAAANMANVHGTAKANIAKIHGV